MRYALAVLALALPLAASGQITHAVSDGVWFIDGPDGPDALFIGCNRGFAQVNGTDPVSGAIDCSLITRFEVRMGAGADFGLIGDTPDFGLDPATPNSLDGGPDHDFFQFDLSGLDVDLTVHVDPPPAPGSFGGIRFERERVDFFRADILDLSLGVDLVLGSGDDLVVVDAAPPGPGLNLQIFADAGDDILDGTGGGVHVPLFFNGGAGDDILLSGPQPTALGWNPGDGTDRLVGGDGRNEVRIVGDDDLLGIHQILGLLGMGCSFFDFGGGGGVIDAGIDAAEFFPGAGGIDLFVEFECGVPEAQWNGGSGTDRTFFRGTAGGGNGLDLDFEFDTAIFTDGFESGDVSSWATGVDRTASPRGGTLWDGIEYQDWPSFADPSTSGPSTVVIRGRPDFPVTLDLGPDDGTPGRGGAVDTLRIDPQGLSVDDDGRRVVIGGGPPVMYSGAEVVTIMGATAAEERPEDATPRLVASPNPARSGARVALDGAAPGVVRVTVHDALGREVAVLHDGLVGAGAETWALADGRLSAGVYLVRATGAGWAVSRRVVVAE